MWQLRLVAGEDGRLHRNFHLLEELEGQKGGVGDGMALKMMKTRQGGQA